VQIKAKRIRFNSKHQDLIYLILNNLHIIKNLQIISKVFKIEMRLTKNLTNFKNKMRKLKVHLITFTQMKMKMNVRISIYNRIACKDQMIFQIYNQ